MFTNPPKILAHVSAVAEKNFVVSEYILNKLDNDVTLFNRFCPHRMYPLAEPGTHVENITCKFHNFQWDRNGIPINNPKKITCGSAVVGKSGLIFKNFAEPDNHWVTDLANEKNLKYSHSCTGSSKGSWLWMMDIQADLLHIRPGTDVVHPGLAEVTDLDSVIMTEGDGWILQTSNTGWWLFVYPFTFVEWSPGCVCINYVTPCNITEEFGFDWITQFYYSFDAVEKKRFEFETLEDVFKEDVAVVELQKGNYFPLTTSQNRLEDHCVHFGNWVKKYKNDSSKKK